MKLNHKQAQSFLAKHIKEATDIEPLEGGQWSQAYSFKQGGGEYVIRFGSHIEDYKKDKIASRFISPELPIPKVLEVGDTDNGCYAISERAHGEMLDELPKGKMQAVVPSVLKMLDAMREVRLTGVRGYGPWNPEEIGPYNNWREYLLDVDNDHPHHRIHGWREKMKNSPVDDVSFSLGVARLHELAPNLAVKPHLIHSDLLYRNVMVEDNKITAVFDWGNSMYGDFLYDLAWFSYWASWYDTMDGIDWEAEALKHYQSIELEVPDLEARMLANKIHIGLDAQKYNAFTERWNDLEANSIKVLELVHK